MKNNVAVVIPARYESTRFPGKPLVLINGISLIQRTYERVKLCPSVDAIIVATDDERIKNHVMAFGGTVCMTSPDCPTGTDRIGEAFQNFPALQDMDFIINVQGDEPCIHPNTIENVLLCIQGNTQIDIATAVSPISSEEELLSPNVVKCILSSSGKALYFSRLPIPGNKKLKSKPDISLYRRHIGIYAFCPQSLQKFISLHPTPLQKEEDIEILRALEHDMSVSACLVEQHAPGVDIPADIKTVQAWLQ